MREHDKYQLGFAGDLLIKLLNRRPGTSITFRSCFLFCCLRKKLLPEPQHPDPTLQPHLPSWLFLQLYAPAEGNLHLLVWEQRYDKHHIQNSIKIIHNSGNDTAQILGRRNIRNVDYGVEWVWDVDVLNLTMNTALYFNPFQLTW